MKFKFELIVVPLQYSDIVLYYVELVDLQCNVNIKKKKKMY